MKSKDIIKLLKKNGWYLERIRGSHHQFRHKNKNHVITVPHPKKDISIGLQKAILKQAGIEL